MASATPGAQLLVLERSAGAELARRTDVLWHELTRPWHNHPSELSHGVRAASLETRTRVLVGALRARTRRAGRRVTKRSTAVLLLLGFTAANAST